MRRHGFRVGEPFLWFGTRAEANTFPRTLRAEPIVARGPLRLVDHASGLEFFRGWTPDTEFWGERL